MMREIKFRALGTKGWAPTENNGWYYGTTNHNEYLGDDKKYQHSSLPFFFKQIGGNYFDKETLSQYTGLKDKNGVEIYEGDLVKFFGIDNPCVIEFKDGGFGYNCRQRYSEFTSISGHNYLYELLETIEVIGNIYENPELLKDNQ